MSAAADSYLELASQHAEENAKSFDEVSYGWAGRAGYGSRASRAGQAPGLAASCCWLCPCWLLL